MIIFEIHRDGSDVVTLEGKLMRQRLAAGLLRRIGFTETIAATANDFITIAAKLAEEWRNQSLREQRRHALKSQLP